MKNEMWNKTKDWLRDVKPPSFDKVTGYASIFGFILTILPLFKVDFQTLMENGVIYSLKKWLEETWTYLIVIWGVFFVLFLCAMIMKYRNSVIIKMNATGFGYSDIMEKTVKVIEKMEHIEDEIGIKKCENCSNCTTTNAVYRKILNTIFVEYIIGVLNKISYVFTGYVSYPVSACLKLVVDNENSEGEMEKYVVTLARNSESEEIRNNGFQSKPVPISENTDFMNIINGSKSGNISGNAAYFYVGDLKKYSEDIHRVSNGEYKYLNSTQNWQDYYIGTLVVPIGICLPTEKGKQYRVWGFICVDSLSPKAFTKSQKTINIKLLQSFASIISIAVSIYHKQINTYK